MTLPNYNTMIVRSRVAKEIQKIYLNDFFNNCREEVIVFVRQL